MSVLTVWHLSSFLHGAPINVFPLLAIVLIAVALSQMKIFSASLAAEYKVSSKRI
jgi:hypothetical protein